MQTLRDLADAGCNILTMGQYLQPSKENLAVERFVHPDEFDEWRVTALKSGVFKCRQWTLRKELISCRRTLRNGHGYLIEPRNTIGDCLSVTSHLSPTKMGAIPALDVP